MGARSQTLQVQHDEIVEHGNRQNVIREQAAEELIARLQQATRTLEAEVCILRDSSEQDATSNGDITILRSELETAWKGKPEWGAGVNPRRVEIRDFHRYRIGKFPMGVRAWGFSRCAYLFLFSVFVLICFITPTKPPCP